MLPLKFKHLSGETFKNISEFRVAHRILMVVLGIIVFLRRPDALLNAQPWAEDGSIFIQQAIEHSLSSLFIPYAGYFHTIPRLVTLFSFQFGLQNTPFIMNFLSLLIAIYSVSYFFDKKFRFIVRDDYLRFASAIFIILLPIPEIFMNITNIQWFLSIYLTLWSSNLIFNYESMFQNKLNAKTISQMFFTGLAFLSTPLSFIMVPFLIWTLLKKNNRPNFSSRNFLILYLVPIAAALFHIMTCMTLDTLRDTETPSLINLFRIFSAQVVTKMFYNNSHEIVSQFGYNPSYLISILAISILVLSAFSKKNIVVDAWLWALIILDILFISVSTPNYSRMFSLYNVSGGERYLFYPITWFLILFIRHFNTFDRSQMKYIIYVCLAIFLINVTLNYELQPFEDLNFKSYASDFDLNGQFTCTIPINPHGWFINVPCNQDYMPDWDHLKHVTGGIMAIDIVDNRLYSNEGEIIHIDKKVNQYIEFTGWAADDLSKDGNVKTYLVFKNGDDEIIVPTMKTNRPDVADYFDVESYKDSGWATMVQTRDFKGECYNISVRILRTNGEEYFELNGTKPLCFS